MKKQPQKKFYKKKIIQKENILVDPPNELPKSSQNSLTRLIFPPVILLSILFINFSIYLFLQILIRQLQTARYPFEYTPQPFPVAAVTTEPDLTAESAIIMDNTSKTILYQKNSQFRFSMASTTKLMTALVGFSEHNLSDVLTVKRGPVEGVNVGLFIGERIRFEDLLYALLLPSGNDAAYAIADNDLEGVEGFIAKMNAKANSLGLENTHFADPAGLEDDQDFTTVKDLVKIMSIAISTPDIATVIGTREKSVTDVTGLHKYTFSNLNKLLGVNGVTGGKTGTTEGAGEVLVTAKIAGGRTYIIIVMKSSDRFSDTKKLLDLIDTATIISPSYPPLPKMQ